MHRLTALVVSFSLIFLQISPAAAQLAARPLSFTPQMSGLRLELPQSPALDLPLGLDLAPAPELGLRLDFRAPKPEAPTLSPVLDLKTAVAKPARLPELFDGGRFKPGAVAANRLDPQLSPDQVPGPRSLAQGGVLFPKAASKAFKLRVSPAARWTLGAATLALSVTPALAFVSAEAAVVSGLASAALFTAFGVMAGARKPGAWTRIDPSTGRLSKVVRPEHYDVAFKVDPDKGVFDGVVTIELEALKALDAITLHSLDLKYAKVTLNGEALDLDDVETNAEFQTVTFNLDKRLEAGPAVLRLEYSGELNREMRGLYHSSAEHEGKPENYAFTHLQATEARRWIPSFDEPDYKATFQLTATAPEHLAQVGNMEAVEESVEDGWKTVRYAVSPKMSSYLLAFGVGRLVGTTVRAEGVDITALTTPAQAGQTAFALDIAQYSLKWLNAYFGLKYPLKKLDLVAVPDFAAGAMENWGAMFFRDSAMLVDPKLSSTSAQRRVAETVAHEIVHQWFGNLVTPKWWNSLWLNEAFATWIAYKIVDRWKPEWNTWAAYDLRKQGPLKIDALQSTRPIEGSAKTAAEIRALFDGLTYSKGGTVLRMVEGWIGEHAFQRGVAAYMERHQYGNTEAADLWSALEEASGKPVLRVADVWLNKPGYPQVTVESAGGPLAKLRLRQDRFRGDANAMRLAGVETWPVPMLLRYEDSEGVKEHAFLFDSEEAELELPAVGPVKWVYPNGRELGFYRVAMDWRLSAKAADPKNGMSDLERTGYLKDLWARAEAGFAPLSDFLHVLRAYRGLDSRDILEKTAAYLGALRQGMVGEVDRERFGRFTAELLLGRWRQLGWTALAEESAEVKLGRAAVLDALLAANPAGPLAADAEAQLEAYLKDPASIDPTLAGVVLQHGARTGGAERFAQYRAMLKTARTPEEKVHLLRALSSFDEPALADTLLEMTLGDEVRQQDLMYPVTYLLGNPAVQDRVWSTLRANWGRVKAKAGSRGLDSAIAALRQLSTPERAAEIRAFFDDPANSTPQSAKTLAQTLEFLDNGVAFKARGAGELAEWLKIVYPDPSGPAALSANRFGRPSDPRNAQMTKKLTLPERLMIAVLRPVYKVLGMKKYSQYLEAFATDPNVATVGPSSRFVARRVVRAMAVRDAGLVVEYGAGEGVITREILKKLPAHGKLVAFELNEGLYSELLKIQDPRLIAVNANVFDMPRVLAALGLEGVDAVTSGIPFSFLTKEDQLKLLRQTRGALKPTGRFVGYQLTGDLKGLQTEVFGNVDVELEWRDVYPNRIFTSLK